MNARAKGHRNELKAVKILEASGYAVYKKAHTRFSPGDIFGLFDIIAVNHKGCLFIQVKTNKAKGGGTDYKQAEAIEAFRVPTNVAKEVWVFKDGESKPLVYDL